MGAGCEGYIKKTYVNINRSPASTVIHNEISHIFQTVNAHSVAHNADGASPGPDVLN
jgi:hypothetical protein